MLREHARLEREAVIAGVGPRIELWDRSRFDADLQKTQARYLEISSAMAKLGTQQSLSGGPEERISSGREVGVSPEYLFAVGGALLGGTNRSREVGAPGHPSVFQDPATLPRG